MACGLLRSCVVCRSQVPRPCKAAPAPDSATLSTVLVLGTERRRGTEEAPVQTGAGRPSSARSSPSVSRVTPSNTPPRPQLSSARSSSSCGSATASPGSAQRANRHATGQSSNSLGSLVSPRPRADLMRSPPLHEISRKAQHSQHFEQQPLLAELPGTQAEMSARRRCHGCGSFVALEFEDFHTDFRGVRGRAIKAPLSPTPFPVSPSGASSLA